MRAAPFYVLHGTDSRSCSLLVHLHVPKCGGTSVVEVFKNLPGRRHIYLGDERGSEGGPFRFYAALAEVFGDLLPPLSPPPRHPGLCRVLNGSGLARLLRAGSCGARLAPPDWRTSHLVAEVHDPVGTASMSSSESADRRQPTEV